MDSSDKSPLNDATVLPVPPPLPGRVIIRCHPNRLAMDGSSGYSHISTAMPDMWDRLFNEGYRADVLINTDSGGIIYAHASILVSCFICHFLNLMRVIQYDNEDLV